MKKLVIGIDISTTACKAIAWDNRGHTVAEGKSTLQLLKPQANWYEQDAEDWWYTLCTTLEDLVDQINVNEVESLCITHQRESFVAVDRNFNPVYNAILWLDARSCRQVDFLKGLIGDEQFHLITGKPLNMNPSISKIVWLMQNRPEIIRRTYKFLDVHAFLVNRLTGKCCTSLASADPMGLVDMQKHTWAEDMIRELNLRIDQFPELTEPGQVIGRINKESAGIVNLPEGLPVIAGAGDGQCAGLGADATGNGRISLNLGTAIVSGLIHPHYQTDKAFRTLYAAVAGQYHLETVIQSGMFLINWFVDKFMRQMTNPSTTVSFENEIEMKAEKIPPGSLGLMVVPYWNQVMTPYWDPEAAGITVGWTGAHGMEHFYRAILEGIAFEQRMLGSALAAKTQDLKEYVVMGGGSYHTLLCKIITDVTGIPIKRAQTKEATCLGAAILAATAAGWYPDVLTAAAAMTGTLDHIEPDPVIHARYSELYQEVYQKLFPSLQNSLHQLTRLILQKE